MLGLKICGRLARVTITIEERLAKEHKLCDLFQRHRPFYTRLVEVLYSPSHQAIRARASSPPPRALGKLAVHDVGKPHPSHLVRGLSDTPRWPHRVVRPRREPPPRPP